jgi:predicted nucleic acid-binding protein
MNVVDSSGWLEYFADGENASFFAPVIEDVDNLVVPAIVIYEVFKRLLILRDEHTALVFIGDMKQGQVADLTTSIALQAAKLSTELKIAMADSIILATARTYDATLWTQDVDFKGVEGVKYIVKA